MMRPFRLNKDPSRRAPTALLLLGALALLATLAFLIARLGDKGGQAESDSTRREKGTSTYHNRAVLPATPAEKKERGDEELSIRGNVYGMDGTLIPGATVVANTFEIAGNIMSTVGSTKSDERGGFRLVLREGMYQINANVEGRGPASVTARSGDTVSLLLPDSGVIEGHVRDERGEPVRHFAIDVIVALPGDAPAAPPVWSKTFDSPDGAFRVAELPVWSVVLRATAEGYAPAFTEELSLSPKAGTKNVEMTVARGCALSGKVKDKKGTPLSHVFVDAESRLVAGEVTELSMHAAAQGESALDGSFRLENVPKGTVIVRGYDGASAVSTTTVEVADCDKVAPVELVMTGGGSITGVARRGDGAPIPGAKLTLMSRPLGFVNTVSDKDGRFRFEDVPAGAVRLELAHKGHSTLSFVKVAEGEITQHDVTLFAEGKGEIRGRITASGKPLAGARLMIAASRPPKYEISIYNPVTDEDGNYQVTSVPPGGYLVNVISIPKGAGTQVKADEVVTVDMDVTPKPPPEHRKLPPESKE
jgi:hypothetical protein